MSAEQTPSAKPKPKGILKRPTAPPPDFSPPPPAPSSDREPTPSELLAQREAAARLRLLQKLRDTELKPPVPLEVFEALCQLPRSHPPSSSSDQPQQVAYTASNPHPADVSQFLTSLRDFQPSEYLDLIEERTILGKCGYTLCPRPHRTHTGPYKISRSGIAKTSDVNKWCSDACAARALYLKVQLDNPSYERGEGGKMVVKLELREEPGHSNKKGEGEGQGGGNEKGKNVTRGTEEDRAQLAKDMAKLEIDSSRKKLAQVDVSALAAERGDATRGVFAGESKVEVTVKENAAVEPAKPPSQEHDSHLMMEGYKTTFGTAASKKLDENSESDDDEFPTLRF
ncbi:hypothetical protein VTI74DRAFT_5529 [Chaetomium olivicolor]